MCIRGAGIVGRALALQLAARRLRVALVDAPASPATSASGHSDVRAYALNAASRELLQGLLTCDPARRTTAAEALAHRFWQEAPAPCDPRLMPAFPSAHDDMQQQQQQQQQQAGGGGAAGVEARA